MDISRLREITFAKIFIQYLMGIIVTILTIMLLIFVMIALLMKVELVLPANYEEVKILELKQQLQGKEQLTTKDFEGKFKYALFDEEYTLINTNIEDIDSVSKYLQGQAVQGDYYYIRIDGRHEVAVIGYQLLTRYQNPWMQKYLPSIEVVGIVLFVVGVIVAILILSSVYAKRVKKALKPLQDAVEQIQLQNLDFEIRQSNIKEINQIGNSLAQMQQALQQSLTTQWHLEQQKREQMAAIAHDIKTPLTIIKGSAELLQEGQMEREEYTLLSDYIIQNSGQIQNYIKVLIEISKQEDEVSIEKKSLGVQTFIEEVYLQCVQLAKLKSVNIDLEILTDEIIVEIDPIQLGRAILNIVSNAIDYTPEEGKIYLKILRKENGGNNIAIQVTDGGEGFSKEALQLAVEPFYMGDTSRNQKGHYGMGLYIAKQIIEKHGGELSLANHSLTGSGQVTIVLPQ